MFGLAAVFAWMALEAGTSPTPAAATDEIETLIGRLREVGAEGIGFSTSVSGWEFLPYPGSGETGAMLLGQAPSEPSPILRKVIEKGVAAVPALLAHIDDARPTKLPKLRDRAMAAIEAAETRKRAIHELYADPSFYARTSHDEIDALQEELAALGPRIEALMAEWEELEREIAEASAQR